MMGTIRMIRMVAIAALIVGTMPVSVAGAQQSQGSKGGEKTYGPVKSQLSGEALAAWELAEKAYEDEEWDGARVQYWRAWTLSSNPRVLFNVGVCDKNQRRYARAVSVWRMQLDVGQGKLSAKDIKSIEEAIEAVSDYVTTLKVTTDVPGAKVFIDNEPVGESPLLAALQVDVGQHRVMVRKSGFRDYLGDVSVAKGQEGKLDVRMEPIVRTSLVTVDVGSLKGATVMIDGVDMGHAPFKGEVPVGRHTIEVRAVGYEPVRQTSEVVADEPLNVKFSLSKARRSGELRVKVNEADATISVDGKVVGSGDWVGVLPTGGHQIVVKKPGFRTYASEVRLNDDQIRTVTIPLLREERGPAWVWWTVGSAAILAGGAVATYFIARPTERGAVSGSWGAVTMPLTTRGK